MSFLTAGVWETAWRKAFFDPYTAQTGVQIKTVAPVSFAKLKAQVQTESSSGTSRSITATSSYGQGDARGIARAQVDWRRRKTDASLRPTTVTRHGITAIRSPPS